ncbi:Piso0_000886 [Millerozyma farinosa CBS 7064]|uniref:Piso0_000886 protein n=1 Tax=Pichia sorbitophila (strain ATCC MYA-4447 / BCRC 22081 / CBS 7064 / NBRC 10061 / NRRL Y-12695) TaxID=559304 RepID=G8YRT1_PICSO|nr:Piso0_000886 [Millerozyma farinosa CBS 7064]
MLFQLTTLPRIQARAFSRSSQVGGCLARCKVQVRELHEDYLSLKRTNYVSDTGTPFAKPNFISFDAFDTLYTPKKTMPEQYYDIATKEFGLNVSLEQIEERFPTVSSHLNKEFPNYGKYSPEMRSSNDWWSELVTRLFQLPHYKDNKDTEALCKRLISHFTTEHAYAVYDDVVPALEKCKKKAIPMIICSNASHHIYKALENLGLLAYFPEENVFISYDVDCAKPDRRFFSTVINKYVSDKSIKTDPEKLGDYLSNCWHIGDHLSKDYVCSIKSGWNGVLLDRENRYGLFSSTTQDHDADMKPIMCGMEQEQTKAGTSDGVRVLGDNRVVARSLVDAVDMF